MVCESVPQNKHTLTNLQKSIDGAKRHSNFHYELDFGVSSAEGARNTKIEFIMKIVVTLRAINQFLEICERVLILRHTLTNHLGLL